MTRFWRLGTVSADLTHRLEREGPARLRAVAKRVALAALDAVPVNDRRVRAGITALERGEYGDSALRSDLERLAEHLDNAAWESQDELGETRASARAHLRTFAQARAAMALWFALDSDPLVAAMESAYEAEAATDQELVRREVAAALRHSDA